MSHTIHAHNTPPQRGDYARIPAGILLRLAEMPDATPFDLELAEWLREGKISEEEALAVLRKLVEITNLMQSQGALPPDQVLEFIDTAKVNPLIEAVRREN
jgi:hypothetical protein